MTLAKHYIRRFHMTPEVIAELLRLPDGFSVRTVAWNNDRMAFAIVLDTPEEDAYLVTAGDIIPDLPVTIIKETDERGADHLRVVIGGVSLDNATSRAKPRRKPKARKKAQEILEPQES